jgi:hypothetical protein
MRLLCTRASPVTGPGSTGMETEWRASDVRPGAVEAATADAGRYWLTSAGRSGNGLAVLEFHEMLGARPEEGLNRLLDTVGHGVRHKALSQLVEFVVGC